MNTKGKIFILFFLVLVLNACTKDAEVDFTEDINTEYNYVDSVKQDISKLVSEEKYKEATKKLNEIYRDLPKDESGAIKNYIILKQFDYKDGESINNMLEQVPEDYDGTFAKEISNEKQKANSLEEIEIKELTERQRELTSEIVILIKQGKHQEVLEKIPHNTKNPELVVLEHYNDALLDIKEDSLIDNFIHELRQIPDNYNGPLSEEIQKLKADNIVAINEDIELEAEANAYVAKSEPSIGMTESEILDSKWGSPNDINKTTTANGEREQWVYYGNKYIYFEDGIVVTIQQ